MYLTVQEVSKILALPERTIYRYCKSGKLKTNPDTKAVQVEITSVYKLREELKK